jgi:hypothetical protein
MEDNPHLVCSICQAFNGVVRLIQVLVDNHQPGQRYMDEVLSYKCEKCKIRIIECGCSISLKQLDRARDRRLSRKSYREIRVNRDINAKEVKTMNRNRLRLTPSYNYHRY